MSPKPRPESLPNAHVDLIVEEVLAWNGRYPLVFTSRVSEILSDPVVFDTLIATHALIWGASPELAKTVPPVPAPKGEEDTGRRC